MLGQESSSLAPVIFNTADAILGWQPSNINPLMISSVPIAQRIAQPELRFLAGLDNGQWSYWSEFDRNPQGGPRGNVYNFPFWQYVDDIYYYMHSLAAVPPAVWTNAAHRNGVRMFAAVTADFDIDHPCHGGQEFDKLFVDPVKAADQLFKIVNTYRFDGWMFDVENCAHANQNLLDAMTRLRAMRLWNGAQVEVGFYEGGGYAIDQGNAPFFQAGSFFQSDYPWEGDKANYPQQSYEYLVQNHLADARFNTYWSVYTNSFMSLTQGDGYLFNGCAYLDIKSFFARFGLVKMQPPGSSYYQSVGIYAPDWTMYGGIWEKKTCQLPARDVFQRTERLLWTGSAIGDNGTTVTSSPCVADFITPRSTISTPPFCTRFNTGQGSFFNVAGTRRSNNSWNYLSGQDLLPTRMTQITPGDPGVTADYTYDDAFDGGSALAFKGMLAAGNTVEYPLYLTQIALTNTVQALFRYKTKTPNSLLPYLRIVYANNTSEIVPARTVAPDWLRVIQTLPSPPDGVIVEIRVCFTNSFPVATPVDVLMGELGIHWSGVNPPLDPIKASPNQDNLLLWQKPPQDIWYYNVYAPTANGLAFIGRTVITAYDLTAPLFPPEGVIGNVYTIQPVNTDGEGSFISE